MAETEKITINLSPVDLGKIDILVEQGFYSNRADFLRDAVRRALDAHSAVLQEQTLRQDYFLGVVRYSRPQLEKLREAGTRLDLRIIGLLIVDPDVPPELVEAVVNSATIKGAVRASEAVRRILEARSPRGAKGR